MDKLTQQLFLQRSFAARLAKDSIEHGKTGRIGAMTRDPMYHLNVTLQPGATDPLGYEGADVLLCQQFHAEKTKKKSGKVKTKQRKPRTLGGFIVEKVERQTPEFYRFTVHFCTPSESRYNNATIVLTLEAKPHEGILDQSISTHWLSGKKFPYKELPALLCVMIMRFQKRVLPLILAKEAGQPK